MNICQTENTCCATYELFYEINLVAGLLDWDFGDFSTC